MPAFAFICVHSWLIAALMPLPSKSVRGSGKLIIDASFTVAAGGFSDSRLESAIRRFLSRRRDPACDCDRMPRARSRISVSR